MEDRIITADQLKKKLTYWQERLRLQDWTISIRFARGSEIGPGRSAEVEWVLYKKHATIRILEHEDYPDNLMVGRNMENEIVHELLHLHLAPINDIASEEIGNYELFEEQAIECIASSLVPIT